jgi:hypothetical protein
LALAIGTAVTFSDKYQKSKYEHVNTKCLLKLREKQYKEAMDLLKKIFPQKGK